MHIIQNIFIHKNLKACRKFLIRRPITQGHRQKWEHVYVIRCIPLINFSSSQLLTCCGKCHFFSIKGFCGMPKKLISFCVDTGFTCFGLVEQNYELPNEVLNDLGVEIAPISRTQIERIDVLRSETAITAIDKAEYETIDITVLRRGVIGVNRIGYIPS